MFESGGISGEGSVMGLELKPPVGETRWHAVCGENRTHGVGRGKSLRKVESLPIDISLTDEVFRETKGVR